jgi:hypothetical protein
MSWEDTEEKRWVGEWTESKKEDRHEQIFESKD